MRLALDLVPNLPYIPPISSSIYYFISLVNRLSNILTKKFNRMSHNVSAVYDVFAARIRACVARPGLQKCGGVLAWE
jgi:hypothetical protein